MYSFLRDRTLNCSHVLKAVPFFLNITSETSVWKALLIIIGKWAVASGQCVEPKVCRLDNNLHWFWIKNPANLGPASVTCQISETVRKI